MCEGRGVWKLCGTGGGSVCGREVRGGSMCRREVGVCAPAELIFAGVKGVQCRSSVTGRINSEKELYKALNAGHQLQGG